MSDTQPFPPKNKEFSRRNFLEGYFTGLLAGGGGVLLYNYLDSERAQNTEYPIAFQKYAADENIQLLRIDINSAILARNYDGLKKTMSRISADIETAAKGGTNMHDAIIQLKGIIVQKALGKSIEKKDVQAIEALKGVFGDFNALTKTDPLINDISTQLRSYAHGINNHSMEELFPNKGKTFKPSTPDGTSPKTDKGHLL